MFADARFYEGGKGYFREPWMVNICSCEMLDFGVVKCDLYCSREPWLSIKTLREMRIKNVFVVNCDFVLFILIYFIIIYMISPTRLRKRQKSFGGLCPLPTLAFAYC